MNNIIKENWEIIEEKVIKPMYEDGSFSLTVADEVAKALEKQIPKNVIIENGWKYCPACYECINDDYDTETNYCSDCGQRLDWEK